MLLSVVGKKLNVKFIYVAKVLFKSQIFCQDVYLRKSNGLPNQVTGSIFLPDLR